jgi:hypothetical protein
MLLTAGEQGKAIDERPEASLCRWIRDPAVAVEYAGCSGYQQSALEPRPHTEEPDHRQPRRLG